MNNERRRLLQALRSEDPAEWEGAVGDVVKKLSAGDLRQAAPPEEGAGQVAHCPPLTRHYRAALRRDWSAEELLHVEACSRCTRTVATVESAAWHPTSGSLARHLADRLGGENSHRLAHHVAEEGDGCVRCGRLTASLWLNDLAARLRDPAQPFPLHDVVSDRSAVAFAEMPRAVGSFATGTRPPFHLRAVASRGDLVVTLRETDQGQLVVHVESPHLDDGGQVVRVELLGEGPPVVADIELRAVEGELGCIGHHGFGPFAELVPRLRPAVTLLAVLAEKASS